MADSKEVIDVVLEELRQVRKEISGLRAEVNEDIVELKEAIATLKAVENRQERDTVEFWAERWSPLKSDIKDIKNRLNQLETNDLESIDSRVGELEKKTAIIDSAEYGSNIRGLTSRVTSLEKQSMYRQGISAGIGVLSGGGLASLIQYFLGG